MYRRLLAIAAIGVATSFGTAFAQPAPDQPGQPGQPGGQGRQGRGGQNWNPEEMRARMLERMKEELKSPDDEWNVLKPKLEKVMAAQQDARVGGMGGFGGGRGGFGGGPGGGRGGNNAGGANGQPESPLAVASRELRTVLQNDNAVAEDIVAKLKAYREARTKAEEALAAARKELQEILTERQEAVLVMRGMID